MNRLMLVISVIWSAFCIVGLGLDLRDGIGRAWFDLLMAALPWVVWLLGLYVVKGRTSEGRQ